MDGRRERHWVIPLFLVSGLAAPLVGRSEGHLGTGLPRSPRLLIELPVVTDVFRAVVTWRAVTRRSSTTASLINASPYAEQTRHAALPPLVLVIDRPFRRSATTSNRLP